MPDHVLKVPQAKEAARLYAKGWSLRALSDHFGVSRQAVGTAIVATGASLRTPLEGRLLRFSQGPLKERVQYAM